MFYHYFSSIVPLCLLVWVAIHRYLHLTWKYRIGQRRKRNNWNTLSKDGWEGNPWKPPKNLAKALHRRCAGPWRLWVAVLFQIDLGSWWCVPLLDLLNHQSAPGGARLRQLRCLALRLRMNLPQDHSQLSSTCLAGSLYSQYGLVWTAMGAPQYRTKVDLVAETQWVFWSPVSKG